MQTRTIVVLVLRILGSMRVAAHHSFAAEFSYVEGNLGRDGARKI
jgi:hypothetical protein